MKWIKKLSKWVKENRIVEIAVLVYETVKKELETSKNKENEK